VFEWQFFESFSLNHLEPIEISEEMIASLDICVDSHDQFLIIHGADINFVVDQNSSAIWTR
jgi:hypothetical protein